jgi:hypothetical protein
MIFVALLMGYQWKLTGDPLASTYTQKSLMHDYNKYDYPGFYKKTAWIRGPRPIYTPMMGLFNRAEGLIKLNRCLFGWPISFIFMFIPFLFRKKNKWDILLLASFFTLIFGSFFYWGFSTRYLVLGLPALLYLTARGITMTPLLLEKAGVPIKISQRFVIIFVIVSFVFGFSSKSLYCSQSPQDGMYSNKGSVLDKQMLDKIKKQDVHNALIFIRNASYIDYPEAVKKEKVPPRIYLHFGGAAFSKNYIDLNDDILFAYDLGKENIPLMEHYSGRKYYICEYDYRNVKLRLYEIDMNNKPVKPTRRRR